MARLADLPVVVRRLGFWGFSRRVWKEVSDDHLLTWAAALAYSWLFAVFPFLIFLLTLIPYLPENVVDEAGERVMLFLYDWLPEHTAWMIWQNISGVLDRPRTGLLSIGLAVTAWAASGGVNMTMTALDRCFEVEGTRSYFRQRVLAIGLTAIVVTLILAVLVLIPIGNIATRLAMDYWQQQHWYLPQWIVWVWYVLRYLLAAGLCLTVVAVMYSWGVNVKQKWRWLSPGALFSIGVWMVLGLAFRWYVNYFGQQSYDRTYGTVGGVAILLLFFYVDALVFMIGAEINSEIDYEVLGVPRGSQDFTLRPQPMFAEISQPVAAEAVAEAAGPTLES